MPSQFLLWSELTLVWAGIAYGIGRDPCYGEHANRYWSSMLFVRSAIGAGATWWLSHSPALSIAMFAIVSILALQRRYLVQTAALISFLPLAFMFVVGISIWHYQLHPAANLVSFLTPEHLAAACVSLASLLVVARGGGYFVAASLKAIGSPNVGPDTLNRGYTIGIFERLILTIVVAFGSFDALAFLVAAKGLVRAKEFEGDHGRHFTEYFIAGTLLSVLLAICAGLAIRITLVHLWPDLLALEFSKGD